MASYRKSRLSGRIRKLDQTYSCGFGRTLQSSNLRSRSISPGVSTRFGKHMKFSSATNRMKSFSNSPYLLNSDQSILSSVEEATSRTPAALISAVKSCLKRSSVS